MAILARSQSAGRGRHGRQWRAAPGNLAVSILIRPATPLADLPQWSLLMGVALMEALAAFTNPARLRLKWPNDVLQDGAKLAGILLNTAADGNRCGWLVIGIGVNLVHAPLLPDRPTARLTAPPAPEVLAEVILQRLGAWRDRLAAEGFGPVRAAWLALAHAVGTSLDVPGPPPATGTFAGLGDDGALLLQVPNGLMRIDSGDVVMRRQEGP